MAVKLESLEFEIQQNSSKASEGIDALTASLGRLKTATRGFSGLSRTTTQLRKLNAELSGFRSNDLVKIASAMESLSRLGNIRIPTSFGRTISTIAGATSVLTEEGVARFERLAHALQQIGSVGNIRIPNMRNLNNQQQGNTGPANSGTGTAQQQLQQMTQQSSQAARAMQTVTEVFREMSQTARTVAASIHWVVAAFQVIMTVIRTAINILRRLLAIIDKLLTPVKKLASGLKQVAANMGKALLTPFRKVGESINKTVKGAKQLWDSLKRIAMYRLIRSAIAAITQGMQEGIHNLYQYSKLIGTDFAKSLDKIATAALYVKNSLAAMVSPIINAIAPAIDALGDKLVDVLNKVNQIISRFLGKNTYTAAKKLRTEFEKMKSAVIGIDELNIIGDDLEDYANMFEELPIDLEVSNFVDKLKDAFLRGDWEELGRTLGKKFNELIESIDWVQIGKTIGYYLNGAIQTFYYFLDEVDFEKLGQHIAEMLNEIIKAIDWEIVGRLLVKQFTVLWDLAIGFFSALDYKEVAIAITDLLVGVFSELREWFDEKDWKKLAEIFNQAIKDLFANLDFKEIGNVIGEFLKELFQDFKTWLEHVDWDKLGKDLFDAIKNFFEGFDFPGVLKEFFSLLGTAAKAVKDLLKPFWDGIVEWWNEHIKADSFKETMKNLGEYLVKFVDEYVLTPFMKAFFGEDQMQGKTGLDKLKEFGENILQGILQGFSDWIKENLFGWIVDMFFGPFVKKLCEVFGIASPAEEMKPYGKFILEGLLLGITENIQTIFGVMTDVIKAIGGAISQSITTLIQIGLSILSAIGEGITQNISTISKVGTDIIQALGDGITSGIDAISNAVTNVVTALGEGLSSLIGVTTQAAGNVVSALGSGLAGMIGAASGAAGNVVSALGSGLAGMIGAASGAAGNVVSALGSGLAGMIGAVSGAAGNVVSALGSGLAGMIGAASGAAGNVVSALGSGLAGMIGAASGAASNVVSALGSGLAGMISAASGAASNVVTALGAGLSGMVTAVTSAVSAAIGARGIGKLADACNRLPKNVNIPIEVNANNAISAISSVISALASIPRNVDVSINVHTNGSIPSFNARGGIITTPTFFHAVGGIVTKPTVFHAAGGTHVMGEAGREAILPLQNHTEWMDMVAERVQDVLDHDGDLNEENDLYGALGRFFGDYLQPVMTEMATDMKRQADKDEKPVVKIGSREIRSAYDSQVKADGYNFVRSL